ncbi:promoting complex subunit 10 [Seminavis robusta]|uniref:Promoting complex subunit 10 n=1 Tax=Seminavis robusta TaxID=568900 RepID=A0A9N8HYZ7_9STRA|nr:promoting complex subunit 10 [Seminavis robusta]|eukprot:Sro3146_g344440.1 promoting complex subunit 10 (328) ;mRNA; r:6608-7591
MYYPQDDMDTPPQPRFLDDSGASGGDATTPANDSTPGGGTAESEDDEEEEEEVADDGTATGGAGGGDQDMATPGHPPPQLLVIPAVNNLDALYGLREIGREALCWQLSSAKPGNGVEQIRDHSTETYWQSDGTSQPHWIQVHFARRVAISHVCLYLDYNLDESYTPRRLSVQVGMSNHDLMPAILPANTLVEFQEPVGWCIVPLQRAPDPLEEDGSEDDTEEDDDEDMDDEEDPSRKNHPKRVVKAHLIQISILSQHQNGRDTHVRQVQLYGPKTNSAAALRRVQAQGIAETDKNNPGMSSRLFLQRGRHWDHEYTTVAMSQYSTIR